MRLLLDLQGAQSVGSRHRGVGRYTRAFAHAVIKHAGDNEVYLSLNGAFPESVAELKDEFAALVPAERIQVWQPIGPVHFADDANDARREGAQLYREFIQSSVTPDLIHLTSLFEGFGDEAVSSIGNVHTNIPTSVTLYDLIPLFYPDHYMTNWRFRQWYEDRLLNLGRADAILSISQSSKKEADEYFNFDDERVCNVGTDADAQFSRKVLAHHELREFRLRYGLSRPFVLYAGGIDFRKNNEKLIEAFASLPPAVRKQHQLAIVCSILDVDRARLLAVAKDYGLGADDVVFTGFVPEDDLIVFYSYCKLFVFPSFHEGFGLPVLEAMRCGAPVIASNNSSVPEILQMAEASFDPNDLDSLRASLLRGLTDAAFGKALRENSAKQARKFSWDSIGQQAWRVFGATLRTRGTQGLGMPTRRRLALVAPAPPAKSGIADYVAELIPKLSGFYQIDLVVQDDYAVRSTEVPAGTGRLVSASQFAQTHASYDRILYQFGNSSFHEHMFDLLETTGGVVVLHDFYISGIVAHREWHGGKRESWWEELYKSHGYFALLFRTTANPESEAVWRYPCSGAVFRNADHIIVHSEFSKRLAGQWFGAQLAAKVDVIPHLRVRPSIAPQRGAARKTLNLDPATFVVCAFGLTGPTKLNVELLDAWRHSGLAKRPDCKLILVGQVEVDAYGEALQTLVASEAFANNVSITGWTDLGTFRNYLAAADAAVQLRSLSRGETSGTILDCLNYGVPLIANANGAMAELPPQIVTLLPEQFSVAELAQALIEMREYPTVRKMRSQLGSDFIRDQHDPRHCAQQYYQAIEKGYARVAVRQNFLRNLGELGTGEPYRIEIAERIVRERRAAIPRLFVDVTHLALSDSRTGIQRVVRNILLKMVSKEESGFRVEPCFFDEQTGRFRFARAFMSKFLDVRIGSLQDEIVNFKTGDTLLCLDLNPLGIRQAAQHLSEIQSSGVRIAMVVYDLLPLKIPNCFPPEAETMHRDWLAVALTADDAFCISDSVARDLREYAVEHDAGATLRIESFPLGADLGRSPAPFAEPDKSDVFEVDQQTFLMVGTIEPRKSHALVLDAFERLWKGGSRAHLLIIGKQGWMVEALVARMTALATGESRFKWIPQASDSDLQRAYAHSTCLIAASLDEGYGLPLLEAEAYDLPVLARDIPVFREVSGGDVTFFDAETGVELSQIVGKWLARPKPRAGDGRRQLTTWDESAARLLALLAQGGRR